MSGAKVIRVHPTALDLERQQAANEQAQAALSYWQQQSRELGDDNQQNQAVITKLYHQILSANPLNIKNTWQKLSELQFLVVQDINQRHAEKVSQQQENHSANLKALIAELTAKQPQLAKQLSQASTSQAAELDELIAQALQALSTPQVATASTQQQQLAAQLMQPTEQLSYAQWRLQMQEKLRDPRLSQIKRHLLELKLRNHDAAPFKQRLEQLNTQHSDYSLRLDSLALEVIDQLKQAREKHALLLALRSVSGTIKALATSHAEQLVNAIQLANTECSLEQLQSLFEQAQQLQAQEQQQRHAEQSRKAILQGLAELGYDVQSQMQTAWAEQGQVVLRKAASSDYALEIGGRIENGLLQMRTVALNPARNKQNDLYVEQTWCAELHTLRQQLPDAGVELSIERAIAAGVAPLKEVAANTAQLAPSRTQQLQNK